VIEDMHRQITKLTNQLAIINMQSQVEELSYQLEEMKIEN
jgi:hypothetical protein